MDPVQTLPLKLSNFEENSSCIHKYQRLGFLHLFVCSFRSKNLSLLLPVTDFKQAVSPLKMVLNYLGEIRELFCLLKFLCQNHWWSFPQITFFLLHFEWKLTLKNFTGRKADPATALPDLDIPGLCLSYKCIWDTRQNNKPKTSEGFKH